MKKPNKIISSFSIIRNNCIFLGNRLLFDFNPNAGFKDFISACYDKMHVDYDRFYKMDNLCKLGLITAEILMREHPLIDHYRSEDIGIIIANSSSSLHSDYRFYDGISSFPVPAVFTYTLPNIVIGELSIRYRIKGENQFFIARQPDFGFLSDYVDTLMDNGKIEACILGWIDIGIKEKYESFLCIVEKQVPDGYSTALKFNQENLEKIFYDKENHVQ